MLFVEFRFFFFFLVAFCVCWALRANAARKLWLLACSYFFYGAWDWRFLFLLLLSTSTDYGVTLALGRTDDPRRRHWLVALSVGVNLGVLGFFKYFNFFASSGADFLAWLGLPASHTALHIILPVGISFYTFQSMSYTIDVYRRQLPAVRRFTDLALFIGFFPQLVAGPIVRASTFLPQLSEARLWRNIDVRGALVLFLVGFIKKACIADGVAPFVDEFFASPGEFSLLSAFTGTMLYAVQIFCDFSGYTDMAIACARLLGYELTPNFNFPYFAGNITDFWRRWHISLSTWLRDYLYIPLGGNRGSRLFTYRNLLLTMVLGGLWHGASWNFVIWGAMHGVALVLHREWMRHRAKLGVVATAAALLGPVLTFYWVCVAWVFFRAADFNDAVTVLDAIVRFAPHGQRDLYVTALLPLLGALGLVHWIASRRLLGEWWRRGPDGLFAATYGCVIAVVLLFVPTKYAPFIYFQF